MVLLQGYAQQSNVYTKYVFQIFTRNINIAIGFKLSVKKGYSMAPVLFMFLMMDFSKTLE